MFVCCCCCTLKPPDLVFVLSATTDLLGRCFFVVVAMKKFAFPISILRVERSSVCFIVLPVSVNQQNKACFIEPYVRSPYNDRSIDLVRSCGVVILGWDLERQHCKRHDQSTKREEIVSCDVLPFNLNGMCI